MENPAQLDPPPPKGAAPRRRSGRRRFLFIAVILGGLFAAQEAVFRFTFPVPEVLFNRADYMRPWFSTEISETRSKALCNVITRWESEPDGYAFDHTLNLYGFRGPDFPIEPPADRPRVVFVGDSYVEGCGASDDDTLSRQFAGLVGGRPAPEVLNLGVASADFPEYLRLMRDTVPLLRPHTVFLIVFANDLPAPPLDFPVRPPKGTAPANQRAFPHLSPYLPRAVQAISLLHQGWVLPRRGHTGPFPFFAPVPSPANPLSRLPPVEGLDPDVERAMRAGKINPYLAGTLPLYEKYLRKDYEAEGGVENLMRFLGWFCEEHAARLNVVYLPFLVAANPAYLAAQVKLGGCAGVEMPASFSDGAHRAQQRHLARVCRDAGIPFVDTTDDFIAAEREHRLYWPIDGHCNAAGYRLVAEACARRWAEAAAQNRE